MESATSPVSAPLGIAGAALFDVGSLAARLQTLTDGRQARGKRYSLAVIVLLEGEPKHGEDDETSRE